MKRILTALILVPIIVYVVLWANYWVFLAVLATVALLCYREYNAVAAGYGFGSPGPIGYGAGLLLLVWQVETWPLVTVVALVALAVVMRSADLAKSLPRAALLLTGVIYIFGCWKLAMPLREENPHWLMYALVLNWVGDTGAYYVGRVFGRHKMAERISPKKSWEGAVASLVTSVALGGAYMWRFLPSVPLPAALGLSAVANIAGQLGDLAESAMKRGASVKDSSDILPGHGGFLDRVDSTLFSLPVIYIWVKLVA
ncbi:MAG TPA: phosphatidate cytidylyltransferase [Bryobacteraceae bacterium]|nr:phosphatidate cytidylyltransferase [Bryobacteraceae bacterium]